MQLRLILAFLVMLTYCYTTQLESAFISPPAFHNPAWNEKEDLSHFIEPMQEGKIIYTCPMREYLESKGKVAKFNNEVHYGIIQHNDLFIAVVLKPKFDNEASAAYAEKIAYDIYENVIAPNTHNHFIPVTVVRLFTDGRLASCQYFVETQNSEDMWNAEFRTQVFSHTDHKLIQELAVFNAVFNNWDRHPGNYLATFRDGSFHFASIDNESIENTGILIKWGQRAYIPLLFSEKEESQIEKEIFISNDLSLEQFTSLLLQYGFPFEREAKKIYNNLLQRGQNSRHCYISHGMFMIQFHEGNNEAFPLPKPPYPSYLVELYKNLTEETLLPYYQPLIKLDPERFRNRVSQVLQRRDLWFAEMEQQTAERGN